MHRMDIPHIPQIRGHAFPEKKRQREDEYGNCGRYALHNEASETWTVWQHGKAVR